MEVALTQTSMDKPAHDFTVRGLFEAHAAFVWRSLRGLGVSDADVDDVAQEVFVVVHRRLPEFEPRGSVRSWLYSICVRAAHGWRRRPQRRELATEHIPEAASQADAPEARLDAQRRSERLLAVLSTLDDDKRAVFLLYEMEHMTMAEVAQTLSIPLQTAYSRLLAARKVLFRAFEAEERS